MESQDDIIKQGSKAPFTKDRGIFIGDGNFRLSQIETDNSNKIIRRQNLDVLVGLFGTNDRIKAIADLKKVFDDVRGNYGIHIPEVNFVIGREDRDKHGFSSDQIYVFSIMDQVFGTPLSEVRISTLDPEERSEVCRQFSSLIESFFKYFEDNVKNNSKLIWWDMSKVRQFVWGHTNSVPDERRLYLVDIGIEGLKSDDLSYYRSLFVDGLSDSFKFGAQRLGIDLTKEYDRLLNLKF